MQTILKISGQNQCYASTIYTLTFSLCSFASNLILETLNLISVYVYITVSDKYIFQISFSSVLHQIFISFSSVLRQFFINSSSALHQLRIGSSSFLHQFFISPSYALHQLFISSSSVLYQLFISSLSVLHQHFLVVYGRLWQSVAACGIPVTRVSDF